MGQREHLSRDNTSNSVTYGNEFADNGRDRQQGGAANSNDVHERAVSYEWLRANGGEQGEEHGDCLSTVATHQRARAVRRGYKRRNGRAFPLLADVGS